MTQLMLCPNNVHAPKWHLADFVPTDGHFGQTFWVMDFKYVLPLIYINFDLQTKMEWLDQKLCTGETQVYTGGVFWIYLYYVASRG